MRENTQIIIGLIVASAIIIFAIYLIKKFNEKVAIFIRDTMKERQPDGYWKWSKTALTMATAWYSVLYSYFFDLVKNGFHMEAFLVLVGVATGSTVFSAYAKKINPLYKQPKEELQKEKIVNKSSNETID